MEIIRLQSGLLCHRLSKKEQEQAWKELDVDVSPIGKDIAMETPKDNLQYYILSERTLAFERYEATIKANGKIFTVKYNLCNQDAKVYAAVRKVYSK